VWNYICLCEVHVTNTLMCEVACSQSLTSPFLHSFVISCIVVTNYASPIPILSCSHWHRTSKDHPQADGLAKRMVQTHKNGFQNIRLTRNKKDWNLALLYIAMGYRMSKHVSLSHFSPYFLLFGKHPIPPSSILVQMD